VESLEDTVILDTDILINFLRGKEKSLGLIRELEGRYRLGTTSINSFELYHGAWKTNNPPKSLHAVERLLDRLDVYDFTWKASEIAGRIIAALEEEGKSIGFREVFIAATVMVINSRLVSLNRKHFERIKGLELFYV
jgi:tRNA(fMet)-specific endonuclease VapC